MKILHHISALVIITVVMALIYASVQQTYRSNANDPQTQIINDLKNNLHEGKISPEVFSDSIDLEKSQSVFVESYDEKGIPVKSSGYLHGKFPQLPKGVIEFARRNGEHWVTWQPQRNVRMAMGIAKVNADPVSFIAAGRSLDEVEARESNLVTMVFIAWVICCAIVLLNWLVHIIQIRKKQTFPS
ncbi:MAG: hypothetical protein ACJ75F_07205 [Flavisolibacter sp.]|jgi:hypothetical protein